MRTVEQIGFWLVERRWSRHVRRSGGSVDFGDMPAPSIHTTIARVPSEVAERLSQEVEAIAVPHPEHYVYPPRTLHVTVLPVAGAALDQRLIERMADVVGSTPAFELALRGLHVSPTTVFVRAFPDSDRLLALRRRLRRATAGGRRGELRNAMRDRFALANLIRFRQEASSELVRSVESRREIDFGTFSVQDVEFVRTDKVLSDDGTELLARFTLA